MGTFDISHAFWKELVSLNGLRLNKKKKFVSSRWSENLRENAVLYCFVLFFVFVFCFCFLFYFVLFCFVFCFVFVFFFYFFVLRS